MNIEVTVEENKEEVLESQLLVQSFSPEEQALLEDMIKAGIIYGRKKSKTNPKMLKYIFSSRKGVELFDLTQTLSLLNKAIDFLKERIDKKLPVLIVGTQPAAKELVKNFSEKFGFSYVIERWLGGTLTNFKVISKRINYFLQLKSDKAAGRLDKYTKKERLKIDEQIHKLNKFFSGMEKMTGLPEAILIIDCEEHQTAVREANRLKIPIVGIASSDSNPDQINYLVPANDNARSSIKWILEYMENKLENPKFQINNK